MQWVRHTDGREERAARDPRTTLRAVRLASLCAVRCLVHVRRAAGGRALGAPAEQLEDTCTSELGDLPSSRLA